MKFTLATSAFLALLSFAATSPVPALHIVTETHTVIATVTGGKGQPTQAQTQATPTQTEAQTEAQTAQTEAAQTEAAQTQATSAAPSPNTTPQFPSTSTPTTTSSTSSSTSSASASSGSSSGSKHGQGTYYEPGLGSCGKTSTSEDKIVAVPIGLYNSKNVGNTNDNPLCGKKIKASYEGKSVVVTVVDACQGCKENDLDFSPSAFESIADKDLGRIEISWDWLD